MGFRNITLKDAATVPAAGYLLTNDSTNDKCDLVVWGETIIGVSMDESSRDADLVLETASATVAFSPLGGEMMVASKASQTYTFGLPVYADNAGLVADGDDSGSSAAGKIVGLYIGEGVTTSAVAGDLIPVATSVGSSN